MVVVEGCREGSEYGNDFNVLEFVNILLDI